MECNFVVGQKVVCINDNLYEFAKPGMRYNPTAGLDGLTKGQIYTIIDIVENPVTENINIVLKEITRLGALFPGQGGFHYRRFAPLKEKKTDISVFTEILNKINNHDHDNNYDFCLDELFETVKK